MRFYYFRVSSRNLEAAVHEKVAYFQHPLYLTQHIVKFVEIVAKVDIVLLINDGTLRF